MCARCEVLDCWCHSFRKKTLPILTVIQLDVLRHDFHCTMICNHPILVNRCLFSGRGYPLPYNYTQLACPKTSLSWTQAPPAKIIMIESAQNDLKCAQRFVEFQSSISRVPTKYRTSVCWSSAIVFPNSWFPRVHYDMVWPSDMSLWLSGTVSYVCEVLSATCSAEASGMAFVPEDTWSWDEAGPKRMYSFKLPTPPKRKQGGRWKTTMFPHTHICIYTYAYIYIIYK